MVNLFMQLPDFQLGLKVDAVITFGAHPVLFLFAALRHHDHRGLQGGDTGKHQIEQDERKRIKRHGQQAHRIDHNPGDQHRQKHQDKRPGPAKPGHMIGHPLTECLWLHQDRGPGNQLPGLDTVQHLMLQRANLAAFIGQHPFDIQAAIAGKVSLANRRPLGPAGVICADQRRYAGADVLPTQQFLRGKRFGADGTDRPHSCRGWCRGRRCGNL